MFNKKYKLQDQIPILDMNGTLIAYGHPAFLRKLSKGRRGYYKIPPEIAQKSFFLQYPATIENYPELEPFLKKDYSKEIPDIQLLDQYGTIVFVSRAYIEGLILEDKVDRIDSSHYKYKASYPYRIMNSNDPMFDWDAYNKVMDAINKDNKMDTTAAYTATAGGSQEASTQNYTYKFDIEPLEHFPDPTDEERKPIEIKGDMKVASESESIGFDSEIKNRHKYATEAHIEIDHSTEPPTYMITVEYKGNPLRGELFRAKVVTKLQLTVFRDEKVYKDGVWNAYKNEGWKGIHSGTYQEWRIKSSLDGNEVSKEICRNEDALWELHYYNNPIDVMHILMEKDPRVLMNVKGLYAKD